MYNETPYAGVIELGARPGRIPPPRRDAHGRPVPFRGLLRWTYLVFRRRARYRSEADAWGLAVAIQENLHRRGIEGRYVMTAQVFVRQMKRITVQEVARALRGGV